VSDKENMQPSVDTGPDAPVSTGGEGNEANVAPSSVDLCDVPTSSHIGWGSYYTNEELRALKFINFQDCPNHKEISHIGSTVCDSIVVDDEGNLRVWEEVIKKVSCLSHSTLSSSFFRATLYVTINHSMWPSKTKTYNTS
jgi:hypothetical protein